MAEENACDVVDDDEAIEPTEPADKTAGEQGKALGSLTDRVEEQQMSSNSQDLQEAMARLIAEEEERATALRLREKELAAVKLNDPADVDLVASELELDKKVAERRLREHGGDVLQALRTFVRD